MERNTKQNNCVTSNEKQDPERNPHKDMWKSSGPSSDHDIFAGKMEELKMKEMQGARVVEV